jgi:putative oxidoreductase
MIDSGLLAIRLRTAAYVAELHGFPKLREPDGPEAKEFEGYGFYPGARYVAQAGATEIVAAILIALGLFGPLGPMLLLSNMFVASGAMMLTEGRFDLRKQENATSYAAAATLLTLSGPGRFSLDRALRLALFERQWLRGAAFVSALVGAGFVLSQRRPPDAN